MKPAALSYFHALLAYVQRVRDQCQCCGRLIDPPTFASLPMVGRMEDGFGGWLELRNCACRSTIARKVNPVTGEVIS